MPQLILCRVDRNTYRPFLHIARKILIWDFGIVLQSNDMKPSKNRVPNHVPMALSGRYIDF